MGGPGSGGWNRTPRIGDKPRTGDRHANVVPLSPPPEAAPPPPPQGLSRARRRLWRDVLAEYDGWDSSKLAMLESALRALDRAEACRVQIAKDGLVVAGARGGGSRAHPLLRILQNSERFASDIFVRLGVPR